ncbi:hypothetical protein [Sphingobacterium puteale]|uniref:hypothetical protein n=1 Tax=Sphingobacterium puteale TaxID=2420510 RepID=UPI003D963F29
MANQFLIKNSMQEMRELSASEIAGLQGENPVYSGIQLMGYYKQGDTPAPIIYYPTIRSLVDNGGSFIVIQNIKLESIFKEGIDASYFGYKCDYINGVGTDNVVVLAKLYEACKLYKCKMIIPVGDSLTSRFGRFNDIDVEGYGAHVHLKNVNTPTMVQFGSNSKVEGIKFHSTEPDLNFSRSGIEQAENSYIRHCGFYNFKNPTNSNSWGIFVNNVINVTIDSCDFSNNTQSDIAIVDNCENVTIISPTNLTEDGVYLNIEPNGNLTNRGINVIGGIYRKMSLLLNTFTADTIKSCNVVGAVIRRLRYKGADVIFNNTIINTIETAGAEMLGSLSISLNMGDNLLADPYIYDTHVADTTRHWVSAFGTYRVDRVGKDYSTINFENAAQTSNLTTPYYLSGTDTELFLISIHGQAHYLQDSSQISRNIDIRCYNDSNTLLSTITMSCFRFIAGVVGKTGFINQSCFFRLVPGSTKFKIYLGNNSPSSKSLDIKFISINRVLSIGNGVDLNAYIAENMPKNRYKISSALVAPGFQGAGGRIGDIVELFTPIVGKVNSWVCTTEDRPSIYVPITVPNNDLAALKVGTTAQRPDVISINTNFIYYNTEKQIHEISNGIAFVPMSPIATDTVEGTVKRSIAVDNCILNDANDLSSAISLVNNLKAQFNAKLTADRNSGQQSS